MIRKLFFFIWFALIVFFSLTPSSMGYQFISSKMALTKSGFFQHVFGYFVLGAITFYTFDKKRIWLYLVGLFLLSALFEIIQYKIPSRSLNPYDLLGNGLGLMGVILIVSFENMNKLIYSIFIFILIFSPLAFGTVEIWSLAIMETLAVLAFSLLLFRGRKQIFYGTPGIFPLVLFLTYMMIQLIPFPAEFVRLISPSTYALYNKTIGIIEPLNWISLSINKKATISEFFRFFAYVCFYILTVQLMTDGKILKKTVAIVLGYVTVLSFLTLLIGPFAKYNFIWFRKVSVELINIEYSPFGPYVNGNHFSAFILMIFPLTIALFFHYASRDNYESFVPRMKNLFGDNDTLPLPFLLIISAMVMAAVVFMSFSRGCMVILSFSFGFLLLLNMKNKGDRKSNGILICFFIVFIILSLGLFDLQDLFNELQLIKDIEGKIIERQPIFWMDSIRIIRDFPITGTGFGSFHNIYPAYTSMSILQQIGGSALNHALNEYIELLTDGGVIAFVLRGWFFIAILYRSFLSYRTRHEPYCNYLFLGGAVGLLAISIYNIFEFNLHIGSNGLYFYFLCGLLVSASHTKLQKNFEPTNLRISGLNQKKILAIPCLAVLTAGLIFNGGILMGEKNSFPKIGNIEKEITSPDSLKPINSLISKAAFFDPFEASYRFAMGDLASLSGYFPEALKHLKDALYRDPVNGEYLQRLGFLMYESGVSGTPDQLFYSGIMIERQRPELYLHYASWLLSQGQIQNAINQIKIGLTTGLSMADMRKYFTLLHLFGLKDVEIQMSIPELVTPNLAFAAYLQDDDNDKMAEAAYLKALENLEKERPILPRYFMYAVQFFMKNKEYEKALSVLTLGSKYLPDNKEIKSALLTVPKKMGGENQPVASLPLKQDFKSDDVIANIKNKSVDIYIPNHNYPNSFNKFTAIGYTMPLDAQASLEVFDQRGKQVKILFDGIQKKGHHIVPWNRRDLPKGTYFYRLKSGNFTDVRMMAVAE